MDAILDLPFTEERVVNGILHYRENEGEWIPYTIEEMTEKWEFEQDCFLSQVI